MSMNPEQENFKDLRRLLVLKRYEQPPPGYFNHFSGDVIARLEAGERFERQSIFETLFWQAPWFQRLWNMLESKPVIAGGFAALVCGFLVAGVGHSERTDSPNTIALVPPASEPAALVKVEGALNNSPAVGISATVISSTEGVAAVQSQNSLFQEIKSSQHPWAQPVSFPGSN